MSDTTSETTSEQPPATTSQEKTKSNDDALTFDSAINNYISGCMNYSLATACTDEFDKSELMCELLVKLLTKARETKMERVTKLVDNLSSNECNLFAAILGVDKDESDNTVESSEHAQEEEHTTDSEKEEEGEEQEESTDSEKEEEGQEQEQSTDSEKEESDQEPDLEDFKDKIINQEYTIVVKQRNECPSEINCLLIVIILIYVFKYAFMSYKFNTCPCIDKCMA